MSDIVNVANEALIAAGSDLYIGDLAEGSDLSRIVLLKYGQCRNQLLRAAHWNFARQLSPLTLLGDASGVAVTAPVTTAVQPPWLYAYSYPSNAMKARFLPFNYLNPNNVGPAGNISLPDVPLTTVPQPAYSPGMRLTPAPFLISLATDYPLDLSTNWEDTHGTSPAGRIVILTNVKCASLVFTAAMPYPTMWDSQFRAAFVAYLAAEIALAVNTDKRLGLQMRTANMEIAKRAVESARVTNGNESGAPQTVDNLPDWVRARNAGSGGWYGAGQMNCGGPWGAGGFGWTGAGFLGYGFDQSVF